MRHLAQPKVLARAALAGLVTSLACLPWLVTARARPAPLGLALPLLFWCAFMLWAFVFAWQVQYARTPVFGSGFRPRLWAAATGYAIAAAALAHFAFDPQFRRVSPADFPTNWNSWLAMSLFTLGLSPLFGCFAPIAFFSRLTRRPALAPLLTVMFDVFILYSRLSILKTLPPWPVTVGVFVMCVVGGFVTIYFYVKGGALLVWWVLLVTQLRHLIGLVGAL